MTEVEHFALWSDLVAGLVSIVLAIVAILFTYVTNKRAEDVNDATIRALQKIESDVARLSDDTRGLIRDAWSRFLQGPVETSTPRAEPSAAAATTSALAAELKADVVQELGQNLSAEMQQQLDKLLDRFREETQSSLTPSVEDSAPTSRSNSRAFARLMNTLQQMSPEALELIRVLSTGSHLTRPQYQKLKNGPAGSAVLELRRTGILGPVEPFSDPDSVAYYFRTYASQVRSAIRVLPVSTEAAEFVKAQLSAAGYQIDQSAPDDPSDDSM